MIHYNKPSITELEIEMVSDAMKSSWGSDAGKWVSRFEKEFADKLGFTYAVATSSCTGALHIGLRTLGIGPGDEVILADSNWIATLAPIIYVGARPVLVDIDKHTWCIDVDAAISATTQSTKAIIATHLYGNVADILRLKDFCKANDIFLIEDAAEALGSFLDEQHVGNFGDFAVFSFHGSKTITTGEGGMFVSNSAPLTDRFRILANHGRSPLETRQFRPQEIGYKYKMSDIQAALGLAQLSRFDELVERKREIFNIYYTSLCNLPQIMLNKVPFGSKSGYWITNVFVDNKFGPTREDFLHELRKRNIDGRVFFWPLSSLGLIDNSNNDLTNSYIVSQHSINLPSSYDISYEEQMNVVECIRTTFEEKSQK